MSTRVTTLSSLGNNAEPPAHAPSPASRITNVDDPRYVKAMSHPLRVRILALLDERTASPVELAGWLGAVSYTHLTLPTTPYV